MIADKIARPLLSGVSAEILVKDLQGSIYAGSSAKELSLRSGLKADTQEKLINYLINRYTTYKSLHDNGILINTDIEYERTYVHSLLLNVSKRLYLSRESIELLSKYSVDHYQKHNDQESLEFMNMISYNLKAKPDLVNQNKLYHKLKLAAEDKSPTTQWELCDDVLSVRKVLALNPNLCYDAGLKLALDSSSEVRALIAENTKYDFVNFLMEDPSISVKIALSKNKHGLDKFCLENLLNCELYHDYRVINAIAANLINNLIQYNQEDLTNYLQENPVDTDIISFVANSVGMSEENRNIIISNNFVNPNVLRAEKDASYKEWLEGLTPGDIIIDKHLIFAAMDRNINGGTPADSISKILLNKNVREVDIALAKNKHIYDTVQTALFNKNVGHINRALASNIGLSYSLQKKLAEYKDIEIDLILSKNIQISNDAQKILLSDLSDFSIGVIENLSRNTNVSLESQNIILSVNDIRSLRHLAANTGLKIEIAQKLKSIDDVIIQENLKNNPISKSIFNVGTAEQHKEYIKKMSINSKIKILDRISKITDYNELINELKEANDDIIDFISINTDSVNILNAITDITRTLIDIKTLQVRSEHKKDFVKILKNVVINNSFYSYRTSRSGLINVLRVNSPELLAEFALRTKSDKDHYIISKFNTDMVHPSDAAMVLRVLAKNPSISQATQEILLYKAYKSDIPYMKDGIVANLISNKNLSPIVLYKLLDLFPGYFHSALNCVKSNNYNKFHITASLNGIDTHDKLIGELTEVIDREDYDCHSEELTSFILKHGDLQQKNWLTSHHHLPDYVLDIILDSAESDILIDLANNKHINKYCKFELFKKNNREINLILAKDHTISENLQNLISKSPDIDVRVALASNINISDDTRRILCEDYSEIVRSAALDKIIKGSENAQIIDHSTISDMVNARMSRTRSEQIVITETYLSKLTGNKSQDYETLLVLGALAENIYLDEDAQRRLVASNNPSIQGKLLNNPNVSKSIKDEIVNGEFSHGAYGALKIVSSNINGFKINPDKINVVVNNKKVGEIDSFNSNNDQFKKDISNIYSLNYTNHVDKTLNKSFTMPTEPVIFKDTIVKSTGTIMDALTVEKLDFEEIVNLSSVTRDKDVQKYIIDKYNNTNAIIHLASNNYIHPEFIDFLANHEYVEVLHNLASNPCVPENTLYKISKNKHIDKGYNSFVKSYNLPESLQNILCKSDSEEIRLKLAANTKISAETQRYLSFDNNKVRSVLAGNPNLLHDIQNILLNNIDIEVRNNLALNKNLNLSNQISLCMDTEVDVRQHLALNQNIDDRIKAILSNDDSSVVRLSLASNKSISDDLLNKLKNDEDGGVKAAAYINEKTRNDPSFRSIGDILSGSSVARKIIKTEELNNDKYVFYNPETCDSIPYDGKIQSYPDVMLLTDKTQSHDDIMPLKMRIPAKNELTYLPGDAPQIKMCISEKNELIYLPAKETQRIVIDKDRYVDFISYTDSNLNTTYKAYNEKMEELSHDDIIKIISDMNYARTNVNKSEKSVIKSIKSDLTEAAKRTAVSQSVKLTKESFAALLSSQVKSDKDALKFAKKLLDSDFGGILLSTAIGAALEVTPIPGVSRETKSSIASEFRVKGYTDAGIMLSDLAIDPIINTLKDVLTSDHMRVEEVIETESQDTREDDIETIMEMVEIKHENR